MAPTTKPALKSLNEKLIAIEMVRSGRTKASVARQVGVPESTLRGWCKNQVRILTQAINNCELSNYGGLRQEEVLSPKSYESSSSSSGTHIFSSSNSCQRRVSYSSGTEEFEDQPLDLSTNATKSREPFSPFTSGKNFVTDVFNSRDIQQRHFWEWYGMLLSKLPSSRSGIENERQNLEERYSSGGEAATSNVTVASNFFDEDQPPSFIDWYNALFCNSGNHIADIAHWQEVLAMRMYAGRKNQHQSYEEWCEAVYSSSPSNADVDVTTTPNEPLHNARFDQPSILLDRHFWKWYTALLSHSRFDGGKLSDNISVISDPEVNMSKNEAIHHGERFLMWLKVCGKDTVTTDEFFVLHDLVEHLKNNDNVENQ